MGACQPGATSSRRAGSSPMQIRAHGEPVEVVTDRVPALRAALEGLMPAASHNTEQYANNRVECDHGRLKARLRPMRGLKRDLRRDDEKPGLALGLTTRAREQASNGRESLLRAVVRA